ncbi:hypothetical protein D3C71_2202150 [compost metagenome]
MLSAVIIGAGPTISLTLAASGDDSTALAMTLISSGGTAPRLLIKSACGPALRRAAESRAVMVATISMTG